MRLKYQICLYLYIFRIWADEKKNMYDIRFFVSKSMMEVMYFYILFLNFRHWPTDNNIWNGNPYICLDPRVERSLLSVLCVQEYIVGGDRAGTYCGTYTVWELPDQPLVPDDTQPLAVHRQTDDQTPRSTRLVKEFNYNNQEFQSADYPCW